MLTDFSFRFADNTTVLIKVGTEKTRFHVHKKFLCDVSTFSGAAREGDFKEAESQKVELPEDRPETFELFLERLYTKPYKGPNKEFVKMAGAGRSYEVYRQDMELFVFADKMGVQSLKRQVIDNDFELYSEYKETDSVPNPWMEFMLSARTTQSCPLRKIWVAMQVWSVEYETAEIEAGFMGLRESLLSCPELAIDMRCRLLAKTEGKTAYPFRDAAKDFDEPVLLED